MNVKKRNKRTEDVERKKLRDKTSSIKQCVLSHWSLWIEKDGKLFLSEEKFLSLKNTCLKS